MVAMRPGLTALVLGSARTLPDDRAAALELFSPDLIIACNHAARDEPDRVDHWATMHPELLPGWIQTRRMAGRPDAGRYWYARHRLCPIEGATPIESWGGSSGLLCVSVAFELGCTRIVLAGVPMQKRDAHFDEQKPWLEARQYWPAWERRMTLLRGRVRSMSGWTREQLGVPTQEWIDGKSA